MPWTISVPSLVLIPRVEFRSRGGHTHMHTKSQTLLITLPTHAPAIPAMSRQHRHLHAAFFIQAPAQDPHGSSSTRVCWLQPCLVHILSSGTVLFLPFIGPTPWGHSGPLCHALSSLSSSTSMRRRRATVPLATSAERASGGSQR